MVRLLRWRQPVWLRWRLLLGIALLVILDVWTHRRRLAVTRPKTNLDPPFHVGCQEPVLNGSARAPAVLAMLARNSDLDGAVASVQSVQRQFNRHFSYPWVFLNDKSWEPEFVAAVSKAVTEDGSGAKASFETIPADMWGYPDWIDQNKARSSMLKMQSRGVRYAGDESYHHMCRFQSGFFYDHPALSGYKWYWRVEPSISFTSAITYDPFVEMERHRKRYGYTMAMWEGDKTAPSLFHKLSHYKTERRLAGSALWTAMMSPSFLPWPLRRLRRFLPNHNSYGERWNLCHFWSNFEIADMGFYRSAEYRRLFHFLDRDGGFYYERWGDAAVHSLAVAMLLRPEEVHHFSDVGYTHDTLQYCPYGPTAESLRRGELVPKISDMTPEEELGCQSDCHTGARTIRPICFNRIKRTVM
ncbi:hypothetical protein CP532_0880 [Ophiocordyceps camponoti-leonardi (nom. inval.)]|nr:hypothetical protein CP532_0880 [Ophiocordyceps camponoti-leonardi (nom. inval.)]